MSKTWLANLKVGDEVIVAFHGLMPSRSVRRVTAATSTTIAVDNRKYRRSTGKEIGGRGGWTASWVIEEATTDAVAEIHAKEEHLRLYAIVDQMNAAKLTTDQLRRIAAILDEGKSE